jgi:hypothetical protein
MAYRMLLLYVVHILLLHLGSVTCQTVVDRTECETQMRNRSSPRHWLIENLVYHSGVYQGSTQLEFVATNMANGYREVAINWTVGFDSTKDFEWDPSTGITAPPLPDNYEFPFADARWFVAWAHTQEKGTPERPEMTWTRFAFVKEWNVLAINQTWVCSDDKENRG